MKMLKDRLELATAINFGKYPVLRIDLADSDEYGLKGCKVRIYAGTFRTGEPHFIEAELRVFRDEKRLVLSAGGTILKSDFTYFDYVHMLDRAQAPLIHADEEVVIGIYDSRTKNAFAALLVRTGKSVRPFSADPMDFENVDMTPFLINAGIID
jgi:hypothetical protein